MLIPKRLFRSLYDYQKSGVQWLAGLYHREVGGGLLGDDMGMGKLEFANLARRFSRKRNSPGSSFLVPGKTYMTLTYLGGLMRAKTIRNALIVVPLSVLRTWENEAGKVLQTCVPSCRITVLTSNVKGRTSILARALEWYDENERVLVVRSHLVSQISPRLFVRWLEQYHVQPMPHHFHIRFGTIVD